MKFISILLILFMTILEPVGYPSNDNTDTTPARSYIAITIDDLPFNTLKKSPEVLEEITMGLVKTLESLEIPAVGFVNEGKLMRKGRPDSFRVSLLEKWLAAGIELGNHTYSHFDYHNTTLRTFKEDVLKGEKITKPLAKRYGLPYRYFRHPYLHTGNAPKLKQDLNDWLILEGYTIAPVTIDNSEWIFARAYENALIDGNQTLADRITNAYLDYMVAKTEWYLGQSMKLFGRPIPQVLLLHANRLNAEHLDELLERLWSLGYQKITLDEALRDPAYDSLDNYVGPSGISWLDRWALSRNKSGDFFKGEPRTPEFVQEVAKIRE